VILLSDCVHNAGPDPRPLAARLPRLYILLDVTGEHDLDLAWGLARLARLGRGRLFPIRLVDVTGEHDRGSGRLLDGCTAGPP
jgi:hypothetical protein